MSPRLRGLISISATHAGAEEDAGEVGHEPDQPDGDAVAVEALDGLQVLARQHYRRPERMGSHEDNGEHARDPVEIEAERASRHPSHRGGPGGIADESRPEK